MINEKSAGFIIFNNGKYLLLHYIAGHWDFPKGHLEGKETPKQAAIRELKEETGITDAYIVKDFEHDIEYFFKRGPELVRKDVKFYLAETKVNEIKIATDEHQGYEWLTYSEAIQRVTFPNAKEILKKAHQFLGQ